MKIPAEFEDIFRGVELTEREALFLSWITSWDDYTIQNMRTVVEKVRSALSTLQVENKELRAELEQVKREMDTAIKRLRKIDWCAGCKDFCGFDGCAGVGMENCTAENDHYQFGPKEG